MFFINLILFGALLLAVFYFYRRQNKLSLSVFCAMFLGFLFGAYLQYSGGATDALLSWVNLVGSGYVRLLQMIVMPLVFISILSAIAQMSAARALGKISVSVIGVLLFTTAIAALIAIFISYFFELSQLAANLQIGGREESAQARILQRSTQVENLNLAGMLLSFIPRNPFAELTGANPTSLISTVIFSGFLGVALLSLKNEDQALGARLTQGVNSLNQLIMRLVRFVIRLTPYGVLALMTRMAASSSLSDILALGQFIIASYLAIFLMFIVHGALLLPFKISPIDYFKKVMPTLLFAFSSRSSAASIPLNIETQTEKLGTRPVIANFSATFGATIGQNGCAGIYPAMLAMMVAPSVGIDPYNVQFILSLVLIITFASFGIAGVGGGATFAGIVVFSTLGFPLEMIALLISVEPLIDMGRTALNVNGAMLAGTISNKLLKKENLDHTSDL